MEQKEKAVSLLSRAEVSLAGAIDVLDSRNLKELKGEIAAVSSILNRIRTDSTEGFRV